MGKFVFGHSVGSGLRLNHGEYTPLGEALRAQKENMIAEEEKIMKPAEGGMHLLQRVRMVTRWLCFCCLSAFLFGQSAASETVAAPDTSLKVKAEQKISDLLGVPVSVRDYKLDYGTVKLQGITIGEKSRTDLPYAEVQALSATCNFMSLLSGNLVLEDISISSMSARLTRTAAGALALGKLPVPASGAAALEPSALPFQKIQGTNLSIRLVDEGLNKTFVLRLPTLNVTRPAGDKMVQVKLAGKLGVSINKAATKFQECAFYGALNAEGFSPFLGTGSIGVGPAPVADLQAIIESFVPGSAGTVACQSGTAEAGLEFSATAQATPVAKALLKVRGVSVRPPSSQLLLQDVTGDVSFSGTAGSGLLDGTLSIAYLRGAVGREKLPVSIESMRAKVEGFSRRSGRLQVEETGVEIVGTTFSISGSISPSEIPQLQLSIRSTVDLAGLHQTLARQNEWLKKRTSLSGKASLDVKVNGSLQEPGVHATFRLIEAMFANTEKKIRIQKINGVISVDPGMATVRDFSAVAAGGQLSLSGTVKNMADPTLALAGTLKNASSEEVLAALIALFPKMPRDLKLTGPVDVQFGLEGKASQPQVQGTIVLPGNTMELPVLMRPLTQMQGSVPFTATSLQTSNLQAKWGTSEVRVSGQVKDLGAFNTALRFSVKPLDLADLASVFLKDSGYRMSGSGEVEGTIEGPPANLKVEGSAKIPTGQIVAPISSANKSSYAFPFQNLSTGFRFAGGRLAIIDARANVFGGLLKGSGTVDPRSAPIQFDLQATGEALRTEAFLAENTSQKQVVTGPINGTLQAAGDATGLASWNGKGSVNMKNGKYQAPPVVTPILSMLSLSQFSSGDLSSVDGTFVLKSGIMTTSDLVFVSTIGKAFFKGDVGLDTTLHGDLNLIFSQVAVQASQMLKDISLDGTSVSVPTKVRGTLLAPSFPGFSTGKLLELGLKRTGQKLLQDILTGKPSTSDPQAASATKKVDPGKELLNSLGDLFKKKKRKQPEPAPSNVEPPPGNVTPPPAEPVKKPTSVEKDLKDIGKDLKKLFKF